MFLGQRESCIKQAESSKTSHLSTSFTTHKPPRKGPKSPHIIHTSFRKAAKNYRICSRALTNSLLWPGGDIRVFQGSQTARDLGNSIGPSEVRYRKDHLAQLGDSKNDFSLATASNEVFSASNQTSLDPLIRSSWVLARWNEISDN